MPNLEHAPPTTNLEHVKKPNLEHCQNENLEHELKVHLGHQKVSNSAHSSGQSILLATALASIKTATQDYKIRALIDTGSELSFISENLVHNLNLSRSKAKLEIYGIGGKAAVNTKGKVTVKLNSRHRNEYVNAEAFILPTITSVIRSHNLDIDTAHLKQLRKLNLADPGFNLSQSIDFIIGADLYGQVIKPNILRANNSQLIAQLSIFGWLIVGPVPHSRAKQDTNLSILSSPRSANFARSFHSKIINNSLDIELDNLLTLFWVQEEPPTMNISNLGIEEQECEEHFRATHSRDSTGRYIVRIPLKNKLNLLGDSYSVAHKCLQRTTRRLQRDTEYKQLYQQFMEEYKNLGHMKRVPPGQINNEHHYYLPHHGVLRAQSTTTKLRVVFNGSSTTSSGKSLNDIMHSGQNLLLNIVDVLLWIRTFKHLFSTDITKMFRQIKVHHEDWDKQRILWSDKQGIEEHYHLTTVTYGTRAAPYLAVRTLLQLAEDEGKNYPLAVPSLLKGRYVDDIFKGGDTPEDLEQVATQLRAICMAGGFPLAKWHSTQQEQKETENNEIISFDNCETKILGINWSPLKDTFTFSSMAEIKSNKYTKRLILSEIATTFDPLGFAASVVIRAKILMQELWLLKLSWDDELPSSVAQKYNIIREDLTNLTRFSIPRWFNTTKDTTVELHGYSDASQLAMAAVIYLTVNSPSTGPKSTLVFLKTRVAPLKKMTIPRLELTAALLLAKLSTHLRAQLQLKIEKIHLWTDSRITLDWIRSPPCRWKKFVCNRVSQIQELTQDATWRHIPGTQNPADCASRGITTQQLADSKLWWRGPPWILEPKSKWPQQNLESTTSCPSGERPGLTLVATTINKCQPWNIINNYSSITKLLRITSILIQFSAATRKTPISAHTAIDQARKFWIKSVQSSYFLEELRALHSSKPLPTSNSLSKLTAFIDADGISRVGGRLEHTTLSYEGKHPVILPRASKLTELIVDSAHQATLHGGTQLTLAHIRQRYWIIGGRTSVKSHILKCVRCARQRGIRAHQQMGQLPLSRVTPSRAFQHTGIDYAGPITLKTRKGRGAKTFKGWICVFVCMTTSAAHLELVSDYSTEGFIATYRRFTARRGILGHIHCDCGTNFKGAEKEMKILFNQSTNEHQKILDSFPTHETQWHFNPPAAPHMGGKWEALVKSTKHHLQRTIGETMLTFEEYTTLLTQIEAILNSRPLEPLSDDPTDLAVLTPGHFLIGAPLQEVPGPSLLELNKSRLSNWQFIQQRVQQFWKQWSHQYLQRLQSISKWHHVNNQIQIGSLVLISDERAPPCRWPLARVIKLLPGADRLTRVVQLRTSTTTLTRPITKLVILPVNSDQ